MKQNELTVDPGGHMEDHHLSHHVVQDLETISKNIRLYQH